MRVRSALILGISMCLVAVLAQADATTSVTAVNDPSFGTYLADGEGRALYLFTQDAKESSACVDGCVEEWPPFVLEGELVGGAGVAPNLLGSFQRDDGTEQVTYFGVPLYYSALDSAPGEVNGQGVGDSWYLVSPFGSAIVPTKPVEEAAVSQEEALEAAELEAVMEVGAGVYEANCAVCHGARGGGGAGPRLDGARLDNDRLVIRRVLNGGGHMPGFGGVLDDEQVAAVVTFVRKSWSNDFPSVSAEEVIGYR